MSTLDFDSLKFSHCFKDTRNILGIQRNLIRYMRAWLVASKWHCLRSKTFVVRKNSWSECLLCPNIWKSSIFVSIIFEIFEIKAYLVASKRHSLRPRSKNNWPECLLGPKIWIFSEFFDFF